MSQVYGRIGVRFPRLLLEATAIVVLAGLIGFISAGISGKGLFRPGVVRNNQLATGEEPLPKLTCEEAREIFLQGSALFIDARHTTEYRSGHIKGAISIPLSLFQKTNPLLAQVSMDYLIVTYCNGTTCSSSARLALAMRNAGYTNVKVFFGGWDEWVKNSQPVEP